jgi:hypothetical protein
MFGDTHGEPKYIKVKVYDGRIDFSDMILTLNLVQSIAINGERRTLLLPCLRSSAFSSFYGYTPGLLSYF